MGQAPWDHLLETRDKPKEFLKILHDVMGKLQHAYLWADLHITDHTHYKEIMDSLEEAAEKVGDTMIKVSPNSRPRKFKP